jgi:hypothetical protein
MKSFVFSSLNNSNIRYVFHDSYSWDGYGSRSYSVWERIGYYDTLGDGETQHTSEYPINRNYTQDVLVSLVFFLESTKDAECINMVSEAFPDAMQDSDIRFVLSLKAKDKKQWYSITEKKVSCNPKYAYDTRFHELPEGYRQGNFSDMFNLLTAGGRCYYKKDFVSVYVNKKAMADLSYAITGQFQGSALRHYENDYLPDNLQDNNYSDERFFIETEIEHAMAYLHRLSDVVSAKKAMKRIINAMESNRANKKGGMNNG